MGNSFFDCKCLHEFAVNHAFTCAKSHTKTSSLCKVFLSQWCCCSIKYLEGSLKSRVNGAARECVQMPQVRAFTCSTTNRLAGTNEKRARRICIVPSCMCQPCVQLLWLTTTRKCSRKRISYSMSMIFCVRFSRTSQHPSFSCS